MFYAQQIQWLTQKSSQWLSRDLNTNNNQTPEFKGKPLSLFELVTYLYTK